MATNISRRKFIQTGALTLGTVAVSRFSGIGNALAAQQEKSQIFFTTDISAAGLLKIYSKINQGLTGKVGIKLHTGEPHGPNILPRDMVKALQQHIANSNLVETNTLYKGKRIIYINVLRNMSVDCDCVGISAAPVKARNLGILASTDLLAVEQASIDMLYKLPEAELHDLKKRIESRKGLRQLSYMKEMKMGNDKYELISL